MNAAWLTDRPELPQAQHNYSKALRWLMDNGKYKVVRGQAVAMTIVHDNWCNVHDGHLCNCRPDILLGGKRLRYPAKALGGTYEGNK